MSTTVVVPVHPELINLDLVAHTAVPIPLEVVGTDQFRWGSTLGQHIEFLELEVGRVSLDVHNYRRYAIDEMGALAQTISNTTLATENNRTLIETETLQRVEQNFAFSQQLATLYAEMGSANARITDESLVRVSEFNALSLQINNQTARVDDAMARITEESLTRVSLNETLAQEIETTKVVLGTQVAEVQVETSANIQSINGQLQSIGARYSAKLTANGLIGGFEVYNDGTTVEAAFDVDTFAIGRTQADQSKPFVVIDNQVFINEAYIKDLTFEKLRAADGSTVVENGKLKADYLVANTARSNNYQAGVAGWALNPDGTAEFRNITARGSIEADSIKANAANIVGTLNLNGNAVTVPIVNKVGGYGASIMMTLSSVDLMHGSVPIVAIAYFSGQMISWFRPRILRRILTGGVWSDWTTVAIGYGQSSGGINPRIPLTIMGIDTVGAGTYQYYVDGYYDDGNTDVSAETTLYVIAAKR